MEGDSLAPRDHSSGIIVIGFGPIGQVGPDSEDQRLSLFLSPMRFLTASTLSFAVKIGFFELSGGGYDDFYSSCAAADGAEYCSF